MNDPWASGWPASARTSAGGGWCRGVRVMSAATAAAFFGHPDAGSTSPISVSRLMISRRKINAASSEALLLIMPFPGLALHGKPTRDRHTSRQLKLAPSS